MKALTEADIIREEAWTQVEAEALATSDEGLMSDDEFNREAQVAGEGGWKDLDLDEPGDLTDWEPVTIEDLRDAA